MKQVPFVYRDNKVLFFHKALPEETQEFCSPSVLVWGTSPNKYTYENGTVVPVSAETAVALDTATQAVFDAEAERVAEIAQAQESAGLHQITVDEANVWISTQLDRSAIAATLPALQAATDVDSLRDAVIAALSAFYNHAGQVEQVHLAEVPYILR